MSALTSPFEHPAFRNGVAVRIANTCAEISLGNRLCSFDFMDQEQASIMTFLENLQKGGVSIERLRMQSPAIADDVVDLIVDLDEQGLLIDSGPPTAKAFTGAQLYRELRRIADRTVQRSAGGRFKSALEDGTATINQIIGYALEYFWIVRAAPGVIGPALSSAHTKRERKILQEFLASELGHDKFLSRSLAAAGYNENDVEAHQPLPCTFAVAASLGVYALQHPLSFRACLFILETTQPAFVEAFERRCVELGLSKEFYQPIRKHSEINDEYDHEDISGELLRIEDAIDVETANVVKQNVSIMIETVALQEEEIMNYYGQPDARIPRIFS